MRIASSRQHLAGGTDGRVIMSIACKPKIVDGSRQHTTTERSVREFLLLAHLDLLMVHANI